MPRSSSSSYGEIDLDRFSDAILAHFDELHDTGGPTGCYRRGLGLRTDLYASLDVAIAHRIMGIDLRARFGEDERAAWVEHINNYADSAIAFAFREDRPLFRLHPHRVVSALGVFGLLQRIIPERVNGSRRWSDIFTDALLHATDAVEPTI